MNKKIGGNILVTAVFIAVLVMVGGFFLFESPRAYGQTAEPSLSITPQILPAGTVDVPYTETIRATTNEGVTGPFYWSLITGELPPPLKIDVTSNGTATTISGTPDTPGDFTFTVGATNHEVAATQNYVVHIDPAVSASVNASNISTASSSSTASTSADISSLLSELSSSLSRLSTSISSFQNSLPGIPNTGGSPFYRDLTLGDQGPDVTALQSFLNAHGNALSTTGPGSPGTETQYFGKLTQNALARWQAAQGISPALGYFGPITRNAVMNAMGE